MVTLRHLLMDDSASRRHPLNVACGDGAMVAHAIAVFDGSCEDVRDGLDAAVWMPREACKIIVRNVIAEVVQEKEWIELGRIAKAERAAQVYASAFKRRFGFNEPFDWSNGHVGLPS
jgi:hypothetical protein